MSETKKLIQDLRDRIRSDLREDDNNLLARIDAHLAKRDMVEVPIKKLTHALEATASNTDSDWRWMAATALRRCPQWETGVIICAAQEGK